MTYIENPKTKDSGIIGCIPQKGLCPNKCADCFFQSGRSYLEPLEKNLPNMPSQARAEDSIVRVNDGNDSMNDPKLVRRVTGGFAHKFYNSCDPKALKEFHEFPVMLTVNPGGMTSFRWHKALEPNLMAVRVRTNTWNIELVVDEVVDFYAQAGIPTILTFMAYHKIFNIKQCHDQRYILRKRTENSYYAITTAAWDMIMSRYKYNKYVHSCGKVEGELGDSHCRFCGNCLREYFATMERIRNV